VQGYTNTDQEMGIILQSVLAKNYPKVRKGLYVFPINWFVKLFWDTLLKPLLSTLQPDIEDKVAHIHACIYMHANVNMCIYVNVHIYIYIRAN